MPVNNQEPTVGGNIHSWPHLQHLIDASLNERLAAINAIKPPVDYEDRLMMMGTLSLMSGYGGIEGVPEHVMELLTKAYLEHTAIKRAGHAVDLGEFVR